MLGCLLVVCTLYPKKPPPREFLLDQLAVIVGDELLDISFSIWPFRRNLIAVMGTHLPIARQLRCKCRLCVNRTTSKVPSPLP